MPEIINVGDPEVVVRSKIIDILEFDGVSTEDILSWGVATNRLNIAAQRLGLELLENGMAGSIARERINAIAVSPAPAVPVNTEAPVITGTPRYGETVTVSQGTWTAYPAATYQYEWRADGNFITGATTNTYEIGLAAIGKELTALVTATNQSGIISAETAPLGIVSSAPINSVLPSVAGVTEFGQTLTATVGTWYAYPEVTYSYQWLSDGALISGATSATYEPIQSEIGKTISVTVTATNSEGNASATSPASAPISSQPINTSLPIISGVINSGQTLSATSGVWAGYPTPTYTYQWLSDAAPISGETGNTLVLSDTIAGTQISVIVTATNSQGTVTATSSQTDNIRPSWLPNNIETFVDFVNNRYWNNDIVTSSL